MLLNCFHYYRRTRKVYKLGLSWNEYCDHSKQSNRKELDKAYVPNVVENAAQFTGYFEPPVKQTKPFTLILPPPNITGVLHLGHALTVTVEDVLVRWNRMCGINTVWLPGIDHAGIATQVVVEKHIKKEKGLSRHDLGRQLFEKEVWKWKEEKESVIDQQLKSLGVCLDWPKKVFTMDPKQSQAVLKAFIKLYENGLIYSANYLVNWSCILQSAISDIEVEHLEITKPTYIPVPGYNKPVKFGLLTKFAYKLVDSDGEIVVATTRPETILGDVAVAVNPNDSRYSSLIGQYVWNPFRNEAIPIIGDQFVDPQFGTGAVKVTPAHDRNDFVIGQRHKLGIIQILNDKGNINDTMPQFCGLPRFEARTVVLKELERLQLIRGQDPHSMVIPICSRSKDVIEYMIKPQWFVKSKEMALKACSAVKDGKLTIYPPNYEQVWFNWLENIHDWCISRQLWWGHRIPMYLCSSDANSETSCWVAAESMEEARRKAAVKLQADERCLTIVQDEDVLDTWFSSALLPFSSFGWPEKTKELSNCYPLSIMETGHDILFFWVARMVMLGVELTGELPFSKVLLHGIVCDAHGRKMSKSLGNATTPEDVITGVTLEELQKRTEESHTAGLLSDNECSVALQGLKKMFPSGIPACGADALRFTLCSHNIKNHFINFTVEECNVNRLFCNKIWQATKFTLKWIEIVSNIHKCDNVPYEELQTMDKWILSRLSDMVHNVNEGIRKYEFHIATAALKDFLYYNFCDVYLESTKRGFRSPESKVALGHCRTLLSCLDIGLRALAPFMPYLAQHLHQHLPFGWNFIQSVDFPQHLEWHNEKLESDIQIVLDTVTAIRRLKKLFKVQAKHKPEVCIVTQLPILNNVNEVIQDLTFCDKITVISMSSSWCNDEETVSDKISSFATVHLALPKELKNNLEIDMEKLETKRSKLINQLEKMQSVVIPETYKIKTPTDVQQNHIKRIAMLEEELERISYMQKFCVK